jgi:multidrug efflux pump subunit AcrA (membrane-fusion protein)
VSRACALLRRIFPWSFVVAAALLCAACKEHTPAGAAQTPATTAAPASREVKVVRVAERPVVRTISALGTLAAFEQATIGTKVPGRLHTITVDVGSTVQRGQIIARIEPRDYELRVQQAEAALAQIRVRLGLPPTGTKDEVTPERTGTVRQARVTLDEARNQHERLRTLFTQGIIPQAQVDTAEAAYNLAQSRFEDAVEEIRNRQALLAQRRSELEIARQQLVDTTVYAPLTGTIQEKRASVGEYLAAGAAIATIVQMDPLRLRAEVSERDAYSIRVGQHVHVSVDGEAAVASGRIARLSPTITPQSRMLLVEADVSNSGTLRPGAFARAEIIVNDQDKAITVPAKAIVSFAGVDKVLVVEQGKVVEKTVTFRQRTADWAEVSSGVKVGEPVILEPGNLQAGQPVTIIE